MVSKAAEAHRKEWALITGGSSGLGEEWARQLAKEGLGIILAARRVSAMQRIASEITSQTGQPVHVIESDLSQMDSAAALFEKARLIGPITVLVNNAGRGDYQDFLKTSARNDVETIQLNVASLVALSQFAAEHMIQHGRKSRIINVGSIAAYLAPNKYAVYAATKAFVKSFSNSLHGELRNTNITVTCVHPGGTRTEFMQNAAQELSTFADKSLMSAEEVVKMGLKASRHKKGHIITGVMNRFLVLLPRIMPERCSQGLVSYFFGKLTYVKQ